MSNLKAWSQSDNDFTSVDTNSLSDKLPTGIYTIVVPPMGPVYFKRIKDDFHFPYKIYGHNSKLVERVIHSFQETTGNLGALLNGVRGTGKSVTAELICNKAIDELDMPVILINSNIRGLAEILASIHQDVVVFVDEFEKVFSTTDEFGDSYDKSEAVLTIMDGALKSMHRRIFLFTTNNKYVNENLLQRPGRLRYVVDYKDLTKEVIEEIIDDMLVYKERRDECIDFISTLEIITVDIVKAVIQEVNMYNEDPKEFKDIFNVKEKAPEYNFYKGDTLPTDFTKPAYENAIIYFNLKRKGPRNESLHLNDEYIGILKFVDNNVITYQDQNGDEQKMVFEKVKSLHHAYAF